ncbi:ASCH domain-containing protein [Scopulibacillus cellulosilyticus]|uniref:ASCH domain-containing protein n=1 Tax=Scopulibacillus cellulosilyticus TaxID=2665665 RepID=A0ABW2PU20_9BACL
MSTKLKESKYKYVLGWDGDNGSGENLIRRILNGKKTATCAPKESYSKVELKETYKSAGKTVTVYDKDKRARCNIKITDVFETTFGNPDLRLVIGEGNGTDIQQFQEEHRKAWADYIENGFDLNDKTLLVAELFELVKD